MVQRVQFRVKTLKSIPLREEKEVLRIVGFLQSAGLEVKVTTRGPLKEIPKAPVLAVRLPRESVWVGTIVQQDQELPAELKLSNSFGVLSGELSFTWQPRDYQNRPRPKRSYRVEIRGEVKGDLVELTSTKALEGNVIVPTVYTLKLSKAGSMKGQWESTSPRLAGEINLAIQKP